MPYPERVVRPWLHPRTLLDGLLQEGQRLPETSTEGVYVSQGRRHPGEDELNIAGLTRVQALFECRHGRRGFALTQVQHTDTEIRMAEGEGLLDRLCYLDRFCTVSPPLAEGPEFRQTPGQKRPPEHRGHPRLAKVFLEPRAREGLHILAMVVYRLLIGTQGNI